MRLVQNRKDCTKSRQNSTQAVIILFHVWIAITKETVQLKWTSLPKDIWQCLIHISFPFTQEQDEGNLSESTRQKAKATRPLCFLEYSLLRYFLYFSTFSEIIYTLIATRMQRVFPDIDYYLPLYLRRCCCRPVATFNQKY